MKRRWISIASIAIVIGSVAWLLKLAVIVATDGRVADTGAAGTFYVLGLALLLIGSTGLGLRMAKDMAFAPRVAAIILSPIAFFASFLLLQGIGQAVIGARGPGYVHDEVGIFLAAITWLALGFTLRSRRAGRPAYTRTVR